MELGRKSEQPILKDYATCASKIWYTCVKEPGIWSGHIKIIKKKKIQSKKTENMFIIIFKIECEMRNTFRMFVCRSRHKLPDNRP